MYNIWYEFRWVFLKIQDHQGHIKHPQLGPQRKREGPKQCGYHMYRRHVWVYLASNLKKFEICSK